MSKNNAVMRYKAAMVVFKNWRTTGLITDDELLTIDTIMLEKYGLSLSSIYRENSLKCTENRGNIGVTYIEKECVYGTESPKN